MTNEEASKVLKNEKECIQRQVNGNCDNKRDCANCDLRLEDKDIILAYNTAISALEKQIPKKVNISLKGTTDWNTKCHCPNCHSMVSNGKYCSNCGQALDFNSDGSDTE